MSRFALWLMSVIGGLVLACPPVQAQWLRAETPHFIVYGAGGERLLRQAANTLESFDGALRHLLLPQGAGQEAQSKLEIYLLRDERQLLEVWPTRPDDMAGFYTAQVESVVAFADYDQFSGVAGQQLLFHEYAHHFLRQNFSGSYPAWFSEGFSEYVMTTEINENFIRLGSASPGRVATLQERWLPLEEILSPTERTRVGEDAHRFYAQSWLMTHYLVNAPENLQAFDRYLQSVRGGEDERAAFEAAFGMTSEAFNDMLQRYGRRLLGYRIPRPEIAESAVHITSMPASADRLMTLHARSKLFIEESEHAAVAAQIEAATAPFPDDPFAQHLRARGRLLANEPARAREILAPILTADPSDYEAHYLTGLSYLVEAWEGEPEDAEERALSARRHLVRAFRINATHVPTLYRYANTFQQPGMAMTDQSIEVLLQAHVLAPQVDEIAITAALALMYDDAHAAAASILEPLAYAPHATPEAAAWRRNLLQAAREGRDPPPYSTQEAQ